MKDLIAHYRKLKSLSAKVMHHGDFLSDVKDSTDTLLWMAPKRFDIVSNKESSPRLTSDGKRFTTYLPQLPPISESLDQERSRVPTWETRGGLLLSILMRSELSEQLLHPKKPVTAKFTYGKELRWHDVSVSEITSILSALGTVETVSYFLTPDCKGLIGVEVQSGGQSVWTQYAEIVENPDLPKSLGEVPKGGKTANRL